MHVHHGNCRVLGQSNWEKYFQSLRNSSVWHLSVKSLQKTIIKISRVSHLGYLRQGRHISNSGSQHTAPVFANIYPSNEDVSVFLKDLLWLRCNSISNTRKLQQRESRGNLYQPVHQKHRARKTEPWFKLQQAPVNAEQLQALPRASAFELLPPAAHHSSPRAWYFPTAELQQPGLHTQHPPPCLLHTGYCPNTATGSDCCPPSHCWDFREGRYYFCMKQDLFIPTAL